MIQGELARRAEELALLRVPFAMATVVRAQRPTSVSPGDSALVQADGTIDGFVGGACAESSVRLHALRAMETGEPLLLRILPEAGDDEEPADGALTVRNPCLSGGSLEIFVEPQLPPARILVVGETPVAAALGDIGERLGYSVVGAAEEPLADVAAVVVASHGRDEEEHLTRALAAGVPYVGLVASAKRGAAVRDSLELPDEIRAQLRTPAGLEIGARTPAEIALAVLAEIVARSRAPGVEAPRPETAAVAIDPVCGMEVVAGAASLQAEHGGEVHYFCCEGCRERFLADPAAHVS